MSPVEPLNFGRKIKDLKRLHKKGYSDLCAGLKISRERIIALEENEREPTEAERLRFANFYSMPPEEFGFRGEAEKVPAPTPVPTSNLNPAPSISPVSASGNTVTPAPRPYSNPSSGSNYSSPNPNYAPPSGNTSAGNYQSGPREARPNNYGNERMGNNRPGPTSNPNFRPPSNRPMTGGGVRPASGSPPMGGRSDAPSRPPQPRDNKGPSAPKDKTDNGEPKPVIKYTAEQLGDIESAYLRKQRDLKVPLRFTFLNGKEYTGVVVDFTPFTVHIIESGTGEEVILRKLAMAYYRKADALDEAKAEKAAAAPKSEGPEQPLLSLKSESE